MKQLIDKFMAGETTCDEERRLFEAFAPGRPVDPELEPYREMLAWYNGLASAGSAETAEASAEVRVLSRRRRFVSWMSAAAAVAMIATVSVTFIARRQSDIDNMMARYAGSYVIENGVKNTDIASILPRLEDAEAFVEAQQREAERRLNSRLNSAADGDVADRISGGDERVRKHIESLLSDD